MRWKDRLKEEVSQDCALVKLQKTNLLKSLCLRWKNLQGSGPYQRCSSKILARIHGNPGGEASALGLCLTTFRTLESLLSYLCFVDVTSALSFAAVWTGNYNCDSPGGEFAVTIRKLRIRVSDTSAQLF